MSFCSASTDCQIFVHLSLYGLDFLVAGLALLQVRNSVLAAAFKSFCRLVKSWSMARSRSRTAEPYFKSGFS